jgi:hypothetical protein
LDRACWYASRCTRVWRLKISESKMPANEALEWTWPFSSAAEFS